MMIISNANIYLYRNRMIYAGKWKVLWIKCEISPLYLCISKREKKTEPNASTKAKVFFPHAKINNANIRYVKYREKYWIYI